MGISGAIGAALAGLPLALRERGATFWVAAMGLLGAGLRGLPAGYSGSILLHGYLTDLALVLGRLDMLDSMIAQCRALRPRARVGFHTNLARDAANALWQLETRVDEVAVLTSPRALDMAESIRALRRAAVPGRVSVIAEVGLAPASVHAFACRSPQDWAFGADAILIGASAERSLLDQRQHQLEPEWATVFPGLAMPEDVL
jgi:hypothetical protein